jgi:hypothetical protein
MLLYRIGAAVVRENRDALETPWPFRDVARIMEAA